VKLRKASAGARSAFALLLFCALLVRAAIPAGWMPVAGGGFQIEVCSGWMDNGAGAAFQREAQQRLDEALAGAGNQRDGGDQHDRSPDAQPCAFAGISLPTLDGEASPQLPALIQVAETVQSSLPARLNLPAQPHFQPPSQGPPAAA